MTTNDSLSRLSDADLLIEVKRLAAIEREATADLIRSLAEVEARRLHLEIGCSSMFSYCTQVLHLSEHAAYARIAAARAATRFPVVMDLLTEGAITLTTVTLLGRHLTEQNHAALLESVRHRSKSDVEMLVATLHPQPDVPSSVRKVPAPNRRAAATASLIPEVTQAIAVPQATSLEGVSRTSSDMRRASERCERATRPARAGEAASEGACKGVRGAQPLGESLVRAIAPERYKLQVTIGAETRAKLRRAQDLLRHTNRSADEAAVIDRALTVLVEQLEKVKFGRTDRPRPAGPSHPGSRYVPAHVRRAVSERDGDRCAFVGPEGRCTETAGLQYHHRIPFAEGGPTTVDNLEQRCTAHNAYEAERWFGPLFVRETGGAWGLPTEAPSAKVGRAWSGPSFPYGMRIMSVEGNRSLVSGSRGGAMSGPRRDAASALRQS
jgi:5-methylcytosine-specific restriction endonuclease McrA